MRVRLGYVAISKALDITSSSTITYTNYVKLNNNNKKLDLIIKSNLEDLIKILNYNIKNNLHFYRLTSKLIPLATHKNVEFEYIEKYKKYYKKIGELIKNNNLRVDVHPDQFCVLNSTNKEVLENTFNILEYHYNILKAMKIDNPIIILHVGSSVFGKSSSLKRFKNSFYKLPKYIQECIALENDDKIYNVSDVLELCEELNIPIVLDYHHHICNPSEFEIEYYLKRIINTWKHNIPKFHFSSPKNKTKKEFRSHHDYIDCDDFIKFIEILKKYTNKADIMLEAKAKDDSLFRLVRQLKYKTHYEFIDESTFDTF